MLLESVDQFIALGWRVVACIPGTGPLADEIRGRGGEVRPVPSPVLRKKYLTPRGLLHLAWFTLRSIPAGIRLLRDVRPDVIYVNTIIEPLWLALGRCARVPIVCHVHEGESSAPRLIRRALAMPLMCATRLAINSHFSMRVLTDAVPSLEGRCVVVSNGIARPSVIKPTRSTLVPPIRLLYIGRISERKGVADAVDAVERLQLRGIDASLDILGSIFPGYEDVEVALRARVAAAGLTERVRFHGFDPDVWSYLARADVVLVPSRFDEPFGNTAVEAILAERPVVATRTGGLVEAISGFDATISVAPASPGEMADAVERIVQEWSSFRQRALGDAVRAADRHSIARYRSTIGELVGSVVT